MMPIAEVAVKLAESRKIRHLDLLFKQHSFALCPYVLRIMASIPEIIPVESYCQLLLGRSPPSVGEKDRVEYRNNLREHDG